MRDVNTINGWPNSGQDLTAKRGALSILCVDDDPDVLRIIGMSLRLDREISVRCVSSANDALRLLIDLSYKPDCILLDVVMPQVTGTLLFGEVRRLLHHRETPVIFLTAGVRSIDLQHYAALGVSGIIGKPFDATRLADQIRQLLRETPSSTHIDTPDLQ